MEASNGTVVDVVKSQSDLSTLLTAVQAADIVELLLGEYFGLFPSSKEMIKTKKKNNRVNQSLTFNIL